MENDATRTNEVSKYQLIGPPQLDKFQLEQMSEVTATYFHSATNTFAPLINQ